MSDDNKMNPPRTDNICPPTHLRVILPASIDSNMPPPFIDMMIQRLRYLKSCLIGEAVFVISSLLILQENYGKVSMSILEREQLLLQYRMISDYGTWYSARILLDSGSEVNLFSHRLVKRLNSMPHFSNHIIQGIGELDNTQDIPPPQADFSAPPPYDVAANSKLPTYEEVQREKQMEGEGLPQMQGPPPHHPAFAAFVTVEPAEGAGEPLDPENSLLGTDIMFLTSFFVAFLFNWIGFLLLMCFCHTVASRYGALSGFGLSLAKWTLIVKHSTELASHENSWLWWLIMAFGILICVRAIIQYLNIKRGWRLLSGTAQERLLFFY